jgi:hypothetical protein
MSEETTKAQSADDLLAEILGESEEPACAPPVSVAPRKSDADSNYFLRPSPDKVSVLLDLDDPLADLDYWVRKIHTDLVRMELPEFPDQETIRLLLSATAQAGATFRDHTFILGEAPLHPVDARLAWPREFFAEGWIVDEKTDRINFREKVENCSVRRNELLLRLHHAVEGEPGMDIYGAKIPVEKAEKIRVRCGKGVTEVDEGLTTAYYSDFDGRVRYTDGSLSVDPIFHVNGHVGLASGNIHHPGSVIVDGDVLADSIIEAEGDVLVKGMVEEADITCGGTLTIAGGILGDHGHKIRAGGNLEARYIRDADVAADGDILVAREISHSRVRCLGSVLVPNGRIAGGKTTGLKGVRVATAGAPGTSETIIRAGIDYTMKAQADLYQDKIKHLQESLKPIENALHNAGSADRDLSEGIQQVVENLALKRMKLLDAIALQKSRMGRLQTASHQEAGYFVVIFKEVWSGTTFWLGENSTRVRNSIHKPRVVLPREDRVRVLPLGEDNMPPEPDHPRCPRKVK